MSEQEPPPRVPFGVMSIDFRHAPEIVFVLSGNGTERVIRRDLEPAEYFGLVGKLEEILQEIAARK